MTKTKVTPKKAFSMAFDALAAAQADYARLDKKYDKAFENLNVAREQYNEVVQNIAESVLDNNE